VDYLKPTGHVPRRLLEAALNLTDAAILIVNCNGALIFANKSAEVLFGFNASQAQGMQICQLTQGLASEELVTLRTLRTGQNCDSVRTTIDLPGRAKKSIIGSAHIISEEKGLVLGVISCFVDITDIEREQKDNTSREKLALIGQMAAGMAHELRNPITVISGFAQLMLRRVESEPESGYLKMIMAELKKTVRLIDDFLQLSRPSEPHISTHNAGFFLEQLRLLVESQCLLNDVKLILDCTHEADFQADGDQLIQVILNLIKNSLEAMAESRERTLSVRAHSLDEYLVITVEDTGIGIGPDELEKVGTPFYSSKAQGTGLGLSLSQKLVENMGGRMTIASQVGAGTQVSIYLPHTS
jgi:PAS domain S-box-containing protein